MSQVQYGAETIKFFFFFFAQNPLHKTLEIYQLNVYTKMEKCVDQLCKLLDFRGNYNGRRHSKPALPFAFFLLIVLMLHVVKLPGLLDIFLRPRFLIGLFCLQE